MMIWFAGVLQDTCCNKTDENKTNKKKTLSWVWCLFHNYARIDWHHVTSVRFTANTQIANFSFQVLVRRKSLFFNFLDSTLIFFLSEWKHIFWARPPKIAQAFRLLLDYFLDAFLKKRMAAPMQLGSRKGVLNAGKKFVIELYVIKSWWKIKFKNKREIPQFVFSPLH